MKHKNVGDSVDAIPAPRRTSRSNIDWGHLANLARNLNKPVLAGKNVRISQIKALRMRKTWQFRDETGHINVVMRNSSINPEDGVRYGDVYFEWISNVSGYAT